MINKTPATFFYILTGVAALATLAIFWPYFVPLALAGVFAVVTRPIYNFFMKVLFRKKTLAALASVLLVFIIVLGPMITIGILAFNEVTGIYHAFVDDSGSLTVADYAGRIQ